MCVHCNRNCKFLNDLTKTVHCEILVSFISCFRLYTVKPLQGLIEGEYQIVVVQMYPSPPCEGAHTEKWLLQFNGSSEHEVLVTFLSYLAYPKIEIGCKNTVKFPPTYPGGEQQVEVPVRNLTRHFIRYSYQKYPKCSALKVDICEGILCSNERAHHTWTFSPDMCGPHVFDVKFEVYAMQNGNHPMSSPIEITVKCHGSCESVDLVALPNSINFGESKWGITKRQTFKLFNFGKSVVHYTLRLCRPSCEIENKRGDIVLDPWSGTLPSGAHHEVVVSVSPNLEGPHNYTVMYENRKTERSEETVTRRPQTRLVRIEYVCLFAKLRITDLKICGQGILFGKLALWKLMRINE
ncbi:unnamed protein product [Timema podura]|uniref:Uncharacterized protein n=1 Tax=Timema podura TaxID=61482 RepID=A0ABN7PC90_TIMPD|nr:unnamed protein product [Timema podura]